MYCREDDRDSRRRYRSERAPPRTRDSPIRVERVERVSREHRISAEIGGAKRPVETREFRGSAEKSHPKNSRDRGDSRNEKERREARKERSDRSISDKHR